MWGVVVIQGSSVFDSGCRVSAAEYADGVFCCGYGLVGVFVFHDDDVGDVVWRAVCPWLCHDEVWLVVVLCVEESESDFSVAVVEG